MSKEKQINDGGAAFPGFQSTDGYGCSKRNVSASGESVWENYHPGMSLRDWFAGQALAGELANKLKEQVGIFHPDAEARYFLPMARLMYRMADAMIEARKATE